MRVRTLLFIVLLIPSLAQAWWSDNWQNRVKININAQSLTNFGNKSVDNVQVLLRLHTGNFSDFFYFNQDVSDLRFIAEDDVTPLKFHIEKFDLVNQLMFVWVKLPTFSLADQNKAIYMYYANEKAVSGEDKTATFDVNQIAAFHFEGNTNVVIDSTAYSQKAELINTVRQQASLIGSGVTFNGESVISITQSPAFKYLPGKGFSLSGWIKPDGVQKNATLFNHSTNKGSLSLGIDGSSLYAQWKGDDGIAHKTPDTAALTPDRWQFVAINIDEQRLSVFINGMEMASINVSLPSFEAGKITLGGIESDNGFIGDMDEIAISSVSRPPQWFYFLFSTQGQMASFLNLTEAEQQGSDESVSYFTSSLQSVSVDGWVVIVILLLMAAISWIVMLGKGYKLFKMQKDNRVFMGLFNKILTDQDDGNDSVNNTAFTNLKINDENKFNHAPNLHLYHQGIYELKQRVGSSVGASANYLLSSQSISAIRATLDASLVRENKKLNSHMVLLTIAIAGGPFLGLLGTVLGVMITFSAIAISGNVDINAIAPGVSAALMTTVAGLFVAIPALFGYNYLSTLIKDLTFDMDVFVDELITKIAEQHS